MEVVIITLLEFIKQSPSSETGVSTAKILLQNLDKIKHMTLESAADFCLCSPSTFSRFLKTIGFSNFKELRKLLNTPRLVYHTNNFNLEDYYKNLNYNMDEVYKIPNQTIKDIVGDIHSAKRVIFYTFPTNYTYVLDFQCKMLMNQKFIETFSLAEIDDDLTGITENDLIFIISFQGNFLTNKKKIDILNKKGSKLILITQTIIEESDSFHRVLKCGTFGFYGESAYPLIFLLDRIYQEYSYCKNMGTLY